MKKILLPLLAAGMLAVGAIPASHAAEEKKARKAASTAPKTVIHVVTVSWKAGTTPEQIKAALDGAQKLPAAYPGITRVWTRTIKAQGERTHAIVMEFASEQALKDYADSDAQTEWYKVYTSIRERSTTFDITN
jgi:antibiotic biosynthesis monooxygenase (ABM) superfamily enzyme